MPWPVSRLSELPLDGGQFYKCSEYAVNPTLKERPQPIRFPEYMFMSKNHFKPKWSANTKRRLKNVIVVMEYVPDGADLHIGLDDALEELTPNQVERLKRVFQLFDSTESGGINATELVELMRAMGVRVEGVKDPNVREIMATVPQQSDGLQGSALDQSDSPETKGKSAWKRAATTVLTNLERGREMDFEMVKKMAQEQKFFRIESGRYFVALSLVEAESLRGILHMRQNQPLIPGSSAVMALETISPTGCGDVLDCSYGFNTRSPYQREIAHASYQFLDSQEHFVEQELTYILQSVQENSMDDRKRWYNAIKSCRRRAQRPPKQNAPINLLFKTEDTYEFLEIRAVRFRIRTLIKSKGLFILEAFKLFNCTNDELLTCSQLYSGCRWLGINLSTEQIHAVVNSVDSDADGYLSFSDYKRAFYEDGDEFDVLQQMSKTDATNGGESREIDGLSITQEKIAEIADMKDSNAPVVADIADDVVRAFKVKLKEITGSDLKRVWNSEGTGARSLVSVWGPKTAAGRNVKDSVCSICVGHYANEGDHAPKAHVMRVRDTKAGKVGGSSNMDDVLNRFLPFPIRYQQVWNKQSGEQEFYAWKPIPPSKLFVTLGKIATTSDDAPPLDAVRCVPRSWAVPTTMEPTMVWDDAGSGGRPGSLWRVNPEGMMGVAQRNASFEVPQIPMQFRPFLVDFSRLTGIRGSVSGLAGRSTLSRSTSFSSSRPTMLR